MRNKKDIEAFLIVKKTIEYFIKRSYNNLARGEEIAGRNKV